MTSHEFIWTPNDANDFFFEPDHRMHPDKVYEGISEAMVPNRGVMTFLIRAGECLAEDAPDQWVIDVQPDAAQHRMLVGRTPVNADRAPNLADLYLDMASAGEQLIRAGEIIVNAPDAPLRLFACRTLVRAMPFVRGITSVNKGAESESPSTSRPQPLQLVRIPASSARASWYKRSSGSQRTNASRGGM